MLRNLAALKNIMLGISSDQKNESKVLLRVRIHGSDFRVCDKLHEKWELEARTKSCLEMLKRNKNFMRHEEMKV